MRNARSALAPVFAVLLAILSAFVAPAFAAEEVDLLLVLAADVSRSVDQPKFQLQRDGYAAAISDPRVLKEIASGPNRRIAICFLEWSGAGNQKLVIDWTIVSDAKSARAFGDQLAEAPRSFADRTSISRRRSNSRWRNSRARPIRRGAAPSTCRATAPTIPAAMSAWCATRSWRRASPSTAS